MDLKINLDGKLPNQLISPEDALALRFAVIQHLKALGLTQDAFAKKAGLTPTYMSNFVKHGKSRPTAKYARKFLTAMDGMVSDNWRDAHADSLAPAVVASLIKQNLFRYMIDNDLPITELVRKTGLSNLHKFCSGSQATMTVAALKKLETLVGKADLVSDSVPQPKTELSSNIKMFLEIRANAEGLTADAWLAKKGLSTESEIKAALGIV